MGNGKIGSDERFVRWQAVLANHVSFVNNLFLTISIAIVSVLISMLGESEFKPICASKLFFTAGLFTIFISTVFGFFVTISRLVDFRKTVKKIKSEKTGSSQEVLDEQKQQMKLYGKITWCSLYIQIGAMFLGSLFLVVAFACIYNEKLF